jgi:hypothetical protein
VGLPYLFTFLLLPFSSTCPDYLSGLGLPVYLSGLRPIRKPLRLAVHWGEEQGGSEQSTVNKLRRLKGRLPVGPTWDVTHGGVSEPNPTTLRGWLVVGSDMGSRRPSVGINGVNSAREGRPTYPPEHPRRPTGEG